MISETWVFLKNLFPIFPGLQRCKGSMEGQESLCHIKWDNFQANITDTFDQVRIIR